MKCPSIRHTQKHQQKIPENGFFSRPKRQICIFPSPFSLPTCQHVFLALPIGMGEWGQGTARRENHSAAEPLHVGGGVEMRGGDTHTQTPPSLSVRLRRRHDRRQLRFPFPCQPRPPVGRKRRDTRTGGRTSKQASGHAVSS